MPYAYRYYYYYIGEPRELTRRNPVTAPERGVIGMLRLNLTLAFLTLYSVRTNAGVKHMPSLQEIPGSPRTPAIQSYQGDSPVRPALTAGSAVRALNPLYPPDTPLVGKARESVDPLVTALPPPLSLQSPWPPHTNISVRKH